MTSYEKVIEFKPHGDSWGFLCRNVTPVPPFFLTVPVLRWAPSRAAWPSESRAAPLTLPGLSPLSVPPFPSLPLPSGRQLLPLCMRPVPTGSSRFSSVSPGREAAYARHPSCSRLAQHPSGQTNPERTSGDHLRGSEALFCPHFGGRLSHLQVHLRLHNSPNPQCCSHA